MSSATDLTKAWLESLPTDVDEPTPASRAPHRSTKSRTHDPRDVDDLVLSSSAPAAHTLRRPQSRGDTNGHVKSPLGKVPTSAQSISGVAGRGGKTMTSQLTDDESSDVDKAFEKLLGDFSVPHETEEVGKTTRAEAGYTSSQQNLEDSGRDSKTSKFLSSRPTVIMERTGHRKLPVPGGRNQSNTRQERTNVEEPTDEVREEIKEAGPRRSDRDVKTLRCNGMSPSHRGPVKALHEYRSQNSSTQTLSVSESAALKDLTFRKPFRNSVASSTDRTYQSSRDFATQTFGQMVTTSMANSEAQTEISAMTKPDEMLKNSLMNTREPVEKYLSQHSLASTRRSVASSRDKMAADDRMINDFSKCRTNSSKSLYKDLETSKKSNSRVLNESFDDTVEKWSKKAGNRVVESDRFDVHSKDIPTADTASVKSRSLSSTGNSKRLMSLMLEEVKALKSFVQTHLDERQTTDRIETIQARRTKQRLEEKDPDSDSAVELAIVDKTLKKGDSNRSKHRSHKSNKSRRHHSRHRRTEDEENEDEYRRRRRSPTREKTWDDIRQGTSVEDLRNRYISMAEERRHLESAYNTFPHDTHPSNYHRSIPATGVNPTAYQSPFQLYQNRHVVPFHGYGQPSTVLPSYPAYPGNRLGYAPMNTHPLMYTMPADHTFPLQRVPYPNSVPVVPAAVDPATYQATVRPALTFVPGGVAPIGQTIQSTQSAWSPPGQFITKDSETRNPNIITNGRENSRSKRNASSNRNSSRSDSQPRKIRNSLNDALREAQGIRNLTERLGKDIHLPSY